EFEKFQSITAKSIRKCPNCGKNKVQRKIGTGAGLIFKGGGFYITDYRSEAYKNAAKSESGSTSNETKPPASGEAKPAEAPKAADSAKPAAKAKSSDSSTTKPSSGKSSKPAK